MYNYLKEKPKLLTDEGQRNLLKIRDSVLSKLEVSGAITMHNAMKNDVYIPNSWEKMAYIDRLVELGEIKEVKQAEIPAGQDRIFISVK